MKCLLSATALLLVFVNASDAATLSFGTAKQPAAPAPIVAPSSQPITVAPAEAAPTALASPSNPPSSNAAITPVDPPSQGEKWRKKPDCGPGNMLCGNRRSYHHHGSAPVIVQPIYIQQPLTSYVQNVPSMYDAPASNGGQNDFTALNIWSSGVFRITAGYLPSNPLAGVMMFEEFSTGAAPRIIFMPSQTGPVRLISVGYDSAGWPLTVKLESQAGDFDASEGRMTVPGQATYVYNMKTQRFD